MDKNARREEMQKILRQNPCLTDEDLAKHFSVSSATIRLDRQTLGIPQMRERMEQLVFGHPSEYVEGVHVLDLDVGVKGVGLFRTTSEMAGVPFAPTQVGNIKYKVPVKPNTVLAVKGRIVLMRGKKKYIYIGFFDGDIEVYRAKFIMEILN